MGRILQRRGIFLGVKGLAVGGIEGHQGLLAFFVEVVNNLGHFILKFFLFREIVRKVLLKDFRLVFQGLRFFGYQEGFDAARQNIGFLFDKRFEGIFYHLLRFL